MSVYTETEELPKWFVKLGMAFGLIAPYEVAGYILILALFGSSTVGELIADYLGIVLGAIMMAIALPIISGIVIAIAKGFYNTDYWHRDVESTEANPLLLALILAFPIAFALSLNTSMGVYVAVPIFTAVLLALFFYRFQPRVPTSVGYKFGLFWASVVAIIVMLILSTYAVTYAHISIMDILLPSQAWLKLSALVTTNGYFVLATKPSTTLQIVTESAFMAFVVGFSEEGWARVSIPVVARYFDGNLTLSVWWLGTTWLSLHAVVYALEYALLGLGVLSLFALFLIPINLVILTLISIFIFYVFAKTGDYVTASIAHGFYDMMVSLGLIGFILAIIFILLYFRYHSV